MGKNTSFSLDEHYSAFIDDEVASGRYRSASDVVRAALRLLEDRETQLRAVREAPIDGERSGSSAPFDFDVPGAQARGPTTPLVSRYLLSPAAQADLEEIWDYTAQRWDVEEAEAYLRRLQHAQRGANASWPECAPPAAQPPLCLRHARRDGA